MREIIVPEFGDPSVLELREVPTPEPGPGQVRIRITSIGMNHAELMARRGQYKIASGEPPFTPGLEAGGVIERAGPGVDPGRAGQRVILAVDAPRLTPGTGTYRSHFICDQDRAIPAPEALPDEQLGAVWLPYLTAWGCLVWRQNLQPGQYVALPAASSSVALAASQMVRRLGAIPIGLTTSRDKIATLEKMPQAQYEQILCTADGEDWYAGLKKATSGHGIDVFFDPVAAGDYLATEIRALAQGGVIWVYGLLGTPGPVDVSPLIRKRGAIRGWVLTELSEAGPDACEPGYRHILGGFEAGHYTQHVDRVFKLADAQAAHRYMEQGQHIGKLVLVP